MFELTDNEEEAAKAYDIACIKLRGEKAVTNFPKSRYDIKAIMNMSTEWQGKKRKGNRSKVEVQDKERNVDKDKERKTKRTKVEVHDKEINVDKGNVAFSQSGTNVESTGNMFSCTDGIAPETINGHVATSKIMLKTNREVLSGSHLPPDTSLAAPSNYTLFGINVESTGNMSSSTDYGAHTSINGHAASKTMTNINGSQVMSGSP